MINQSGTYFRDIHANLVKKLPEFPSDDPSPNLRGCIQSANFVRAEMLSRQHNLSSDVITHIQEMAILQHVIDFKNGPGLQKLVAEFNISAAQIERIVGLIADEKQYPCTSFSRNTELAIDENWADVWKTEYVPIVNQVVKRKASILSRFIEWIKRIFRGKRT